jgi:serine O-acetyltransferase
MIKSKKDYYSYLEADRIALDKPKLSLLVKLKEYLSRDHIWRFQRLLRKLEYYKNVKNKFSVFFRIYYVLLKIKLKNLSLKLGFSIPENVFGPGLAIIHYGTIIINSRAKIGSNCRIHACTNIGESGGVAGAPVIGDNVYIGPGAKIYGDISIPNNVAIAANAAVGKSFLNENKVIGGVPAKEIGAVHIKQLIKHI